MNKVNHISVLPSETTQFLDVSFGAKVLDGTLGLGGHAKMILPMLGPAGHYYGFDLDQDNLSEAKRRLADHADQLTTFHDNFMNAPERLHENGVEEVDAILLDLGLSSPHIDDPERGFSLQNDGPLDMRFDRSEEGMTAAEVVNGWSEVELKRIFYEYGEERYAPKLARLIVEKRQAQPFERTSDLVELIVTFIHSSGDQRRMATRVFQALRIAVNDELQVLETALRSHLDLLAKGGRMVVISYHSLEDRLVKNAFRDAAKKCVCPSEAIRCTCERKPKFKVITKKPVTPSKSEIESNPRSRSAKLRCIERL